MACYKAKYIVNMFIIIQENGISYNTAYEVISDFTPEELNEQETNPFEETPDTVIKQKQLLKDRIFSESKRQPLLKKRDTINKIKIEKKAETYQRCRNFTLSEKKLILWSKRIVMHGDIDQPTAIMTRQIKVHKIAFEISKSGEQDKTKSAYQKFKKGLTSKQKAKLKKEKEEFALEDHIDKVYCRDQVLLVNDEECTLI